MRGDFPVVGVDCTPLLVRSAGVKTYLYHWLKAMQAMRPEAIRTFLAPGNLDTLRHDGGVFMHPRQILTLLALNRLPRFATDALAPRCDVFHVTNLLHRSPSGARLSATLHDLTPWVVPQCHTQTIVDADREFAARVLTRADGLMADSENTRRDAIRILGIRPEKIHVVYLGVPSEYFRVPPEAAAAAAASCQLGRPYFLSVGTIEPRKNLDTLLDAWDTLPPAFRAEYDLAIVGMPGWRSDATMHRIRTANVRYLGYVPEAFMPGLTAGAAALLYPSLYEGFGLPVVQAMAAGCPVVTSNVSSLPEITGGAALLVDPNSAGEIASAILRMDSAGLREKLRSEGMAQAAQFTWEAAAEASFRYFAELA